MSTKDRVLVELERLRAISQRRPLIEDEAAEREAYEKVLFWIADDEEAERQREAAKRTAEEEERLEAETRPDPNAKTKELFGSYREKLKREGKMR